MHFYISHVKFAHFWCWSNMNLKLNFFHLLCFDHYSKIPPKNVHSCRFRHTPVLEYCTSTFLNAVYVICLWYSLKYIQVLMINILMYIGYSTCTCFFSGKYQSASVINSLKDLLRNEDSNIRAVAAVSLAKTGNQDKSTINVLLKCLNDKDRLVRESGCLALGHMKAKRAVPKLLHLW